MGFVAGPVVVTVPATSANLGPGFDAFGLALGLRDRLEGEVLEGGLVVEVVGEGEGVVPLDERHLVVRAMHAAFDAMGSRPPGLRLTCHNRIPHARGLGSSSAAIVGGLALARALVAGGTLLLGDDELFAIAARLEGHPDNVAPACFGGFVVAGRDTADDAGPGDFFAVPCDVDPRVGAVVLVPPVGVETTVARGLLPAQVPHADAAANAGRAALLVAALGGRPEHLLRATEDRLHQDPRRPAMPATLDLVHALRDRGLAALVSGAGPTVLVLTGAPPTEGAAVEAMAACPDGWTAWHLPVDREGVRAEV